MKPNYTYVIQGEIRREAADNISKHFLHILLSIKGFFRKVRSHSFVSNYTTPHIYITTSLAQPMLVLLVPVMDIVNIYSAVPEKLGPISPYYFL